MALVGPDGALPEDMRRPLLACRDPAAAAKARVPAAARHLRPDAPWRREGERRPGSTRVSTTAHDPVRWFSEHFDDAADEILGLPRRRRHLARGPARGRRGLWRRDHRPRARAQGPPGGAGGLRPDGRRPGGAAARGPGSRRCGTSCRRACASSARSPRAFPPPEQLRHRHDVVGVRARGRPGGAAGRGQAGDQARGLSCSCSSGRSTTPSTAATSGLTTRAPTRTSSERRADPEPRWRAARHGPTPDRR